MKELLATIDAWRAEDVGFGRAVLVRAFGSAPRPEGATLLVADDGRLAGSVSGGCVEGAAAEAIAQARRTGRARVVRYGISDEQAWNVGLACGSTIDVLIEPELRPEIEDLARSDGGAAAALHLPAGPLTVIDAGSDTELATAARALLAEGRSGTVEVGGVEYFVQAFPSPPRVVIFGAVQVAVPLVRMAHELGYRTAVADAREAFVTRERFPEADELHTGWPDEVAESVRLGPTDAVVVMNHDPKLDEPAIVAAMRAGCSYVGAIGSRRTQAARRERLRAAGLGDEELGRLRAPIGLDLGGREPPETALAILAEIVALRHGAPAAQFARR